MVTLTTPNGYTFTSEAFVTINGKKYCLDDMPREQKNLVATQLNAQALNAAYAGRRVYRPETPLPPVEEVFPDQKDRA